MRIEMQKLEKRNTYTPLNTSQVQSSVAMSLKREETLSEHGLKTFSSILDVNQHSGKNGQDLRVPVLNMRGKPFHGEKTPCVSWEMNRHEKIKMVEEKW